MITEGKVIEIIRNTEKFRNFFLCEYSGCCM